MKKIILSGAFVIAAFTMNSFAAFSPVIAKATNTISNAAAKATQAGNIVSSKASNIQGLLTSGQQMINTQVQQKVSSVVPPQVNAQTPEQTIQAKEALIQKLQTEVAKEKAKINEEKNREAKKAKAKEILAKNYN